MRILAVDDSNDILNMIKTALTSFGHEVEVAENGAEALIKYVKFNPDIVTLDVSMPIMNGYETLTRLLKLDKNAKIIILTASEHWSLIENCLAKGAVGYLAKPFTIDELVQTVSDPWHYIDKNAVVIFSISCNSIGNSIQKIFGSPASVKLSTVELVMRQDDSYYNFSSSRGLQQVRVIERIAEQTPLLVADHVGYVNEFAGHIRGLVASFVNSKHIEQTKIALSNCLLGSLDLNEFFHIINSKVFSTLAEHHRLPVELEPIKKFDEMLAKTIPPTNERMKANIEIVTKSLTLPIEINIISNLKTTIRRLDEKV